MAKFTIGQTITTSSPDIEVSVAPDIPLPPGNHRFQLVVVDDGGQSSEPVTVEVVVIDDAKPTAVIDAPAVLTQGASFTLSGRRSLDMAPGRIVEYKWLQIS
jgi:hypothetical protein